MANYRAKIESGVPAADGDVHLNCKVECEIEEGVWELVPMGHFTLVLDGGTVLSITESAMTDQEKRDALVGLFKQEAERRGIHISDDAYNQLYDLLLTGWPVMVGL